MSGDDQVWSVLGSWGWWWLWVAGSAGSQLQWLVQWWVASGNMPKIWFHLMVSDSWLPDRCCLDTGCLIVWLSDNNQMSSVNIRHYQMLSDNQTTDNQCFRHCQTIRPSDNQCSSTTQAIRQSDQVQKTGVQKQYFANILNLAAFGLVILARMWSHDFLGFLKFFWNLLILFKAVFDNIFCKGVNKESTRSPCPLLVFYVNLSGVYRESWGVLRSPGVHKESIMVTLL